VKIGVNQGRLAIIIAAAFKIDSRGRERFCLG